MGIPVSSDRHLYPCTPRDMRMSDGMSITITDGGPYIVRGNVPLFEKRIVRRGGLYVWEDVREIPHGETYALCRCGKTRDAPFCDGGSHKRFKGKEKADRRPYAERCQRIEGPGMIIGDDMRCSLSRFCHRAEGTPWKMLPRSDDPGIRDEIVRAVVECPSGRLSVIEDGVPTDHVPEPAIWVVQDPENRVSGGLYVMGGIPIVGSDGFVYESRGRTVLCRCGVSGDMPFCDSSHINNMFRDDRNRR